MLGGVPGVAPAHVTVLGAGSVGANAAKVAAGFGATPGTPPSRIPRPICGFSRYFAPSWMLIRPATSLIGMSSGSRPRSSRSVS
ncbi:MAG: hypothetical protein ACKOK8_03340 [Planctomycetia bacterium]